MGGVDGRGQGGERMGWIGVGFGDEDVLRVLDGCQATAAAPMISNDPLGFESTQSCINKRAGASPSRSTGETKTQVGLQNCLGAAQTPQVTVQSPLKQMHQLGRSWT